MKASELKTIIETLESLGHSDVRIMREVEDQGYAEVNIKTYVDESNVVTLIVEDE